ncbi:cupin domain-containing protein [bacterium]|nr:cupin domain-containing protein [bacterium]
MKNSVRTVYVNGNEQVFTFSDEWNTSDGKVRQLRYHLAPGASVATHLHPKTRQTFEVLSGELWIRAGWKKMKLKKGDRAQTTLGGSHSQWNTSSTEFVEVVEGYDPPLDIEPFFTALPVVLKCKNPLKICVFFSDFSSIVTARTWPVRWLIKGFGSIGRFLGYDKWYKEDVPLLIKP